MRADQGHSYQGQPVRDYCQNRDQWFEAIAKHHSIPLRTPTGVTKEEAVKALPIRLVHGGNYGEWAKDAALTRKAWWKPSSRWIAWCHLAWIVLILCTSSS